MDLVAKVFELFEEWNQGLLNYALTYQQRQLLEGLEFKRRLKTA